MMYDFWLTEAKEELAAIKDFILKYKDISKSRKDNL